MIDPICTLVIVIDPILTIMIDPICTSRHHEQSNRAIMINTNLYNHEGTIGLFMVVRTQMGSIIIVKLDHDDIYYQS